MSANTVTQQLNQVYNNLTDKTADGVRVEKVDIPQGSYASGISVTDVVADTGQATNITTAVPIVYGAGTFNTQASTLAAAGEESFTMTNSSIAVTDICVLNAKYNGTGGSPIVYVSDVAAGVFTVTISNLHASAALDGDFDINYFIIKMSA
jgi:hypothetical protein